MRNKLKEYIDFIFNSAPKCRESEELKEEILYNSFEKYEDLISAGKSESEAYVLVVSSIGDIEPLLENIRSSSASARTGESASAEHLTDSTGAVRELTANEIELKEKYELKRGIMSTIAVILYMTCWLPLVILSAFPVFGLGSAIIGLALLMLFVAVATALEIMKGVIAPSFLKDANKSEEKGKIKAEKKEEKKEKKKSPLHSLMDNIMWAIITLTYFLVSIFTGKWGVSWIIFILGGALDNILDSIFEYKEYSKEEEK